MSNSIVDYVFRALGVEYLKRDELAQVPPDRSAELPEPKKGIALDAGVQLDLEDAAKERDIDAQIAAAEFVDTDDDRLARLGGSASPSPASTPTSSRGGSAVPAARLSPGPGAMAAPVTNGNGTAPATAGAVGVVPDVQTAGIQAVLADKMGDAPLCDTCGHITVRNGSCYRCLNCGDSKGCS
jgi:ribonucleoside-diphosphate reductase alpha chain